MTTIAEDVTIQGTLRVIGGMLPSVPRTSLTQDDLKAFPVPLIQLRVWDAPGTNLPTTSSSDDLGYYNQTFGTAVPYVGTSDLSAAGATTRYARFGFTLPPEYVTGESVQIRAHAGMITTAADVTATIDFEAYLLNRGTSSSITGSDLVTTSATSINSLTFGNKDFSLTTSALAPGAFIDVRVAIAVNDGSAGGAVIGALTNIEVLCDIQG